MESELLPPSVDPKTPRIGIRKVRGSNVATCRTETAEAASAVRNIPQTIQGWRPSSVTTHPSWMAI